MKSRIGPAITAWMGTLLVSGGAVAAPAAVSRPPAIILGGEVYNSSTSSPSYMAALFKALNLNTVLVTVSWDQMEPVEGHFDFTAIDAALDNARRQDLHLGVLWLAAFKNGRSTYAPTWVRADPARFPRVVTSKPLRPTGASTTTPPPFCRCSVGLLSKPTRGRSPRSWLI